MLARRVLFVSAVFSFLTASLFSQRVAPWQNPDFGSDSLSRIECAYNLSTMSEFMKINLLDYALPSWRKVYENCPGSSKNIYILGARIFCDKIENSTEQDIKTAYLDTLMMLHDKRIQYFGEEGNVLGRKAIDIIKYGNQDAYADAYPMFKKSALLSEVETETNVLIGLSETGLAMYKAGKISLIEFLENYVLLTDLIEKQSTDTRMRSRANMASQRIEANLAEAGINDCSEIEKVFKSRIDSSPVDEKTLATVSSLLKNAGCNQEIFFRDVYLKIFNSAPTADIASELSMHYIKNDDFVNAAEFFIKSYELEQNEERKAQYAMQVSILMYSRLNKYQEAVEYALIASRLKPDWGEPYFAMAPAYIEGIKQCTNEAFDRLAVYWLAADLMEKAAQIDSSVSNKARNQLAEYRKYFPSKEEAFFRSIQNGSSFSFGCWINRNVTARFN